MIKGAWWKYLGAALVLYSLVAGMLIPLGPGIDGVSPVALAAGERHVLTVNGYNTHYREGDMQAWLRLSAKYNLAAQQIIVQDDRTVQLTFDIPKKVPSPDTVTAVSLIVDHQQDGLSVLPSAIFLTECSPSSDDADWLLEVETAGPQYFHFPYRGRLAETIRNTYYHVPLWFGLMIVLTMSMIKAVQYLRTRDAKADHQSFGYASSGVVLGLLGLATGALWAKHAWGAYWSFDIKQNMTAIALLIYLAYFILRSALPDRDLAAKFSAVYNIFAFALLVPLLYIIPRMVMSLHPGAGGNPAFAGEDLDNTMRMVFYPAVVGWILLGLWMGQVHGRLLTIQEKIHLRTTK